MARGGGSDAEGRALARAVSGRIIGITPTTALHAGCFG
jgi:hypothetical protein